MNGTRVYMTGASPEECWPLVCDFHYSQRMPGNIQHCYAVRRGGGLFGDFGDIEAAAIFSIPPTRWAEAVIELTRLVRRDDWTVPLSQLVAFACKQLRARRHALVVSFADRTQRHFGGIYQACNWRYAGCRDRRMDGVVIDGQFWPGRSLNSRYNTQSPEKLSRILPGRAITPHYDEGKHLYWKPLNMAGKTRAKRLGLQSLPYPKEFAARLADAPPPGGVSLEHTQGAAPIFAEEAE